MKVDKKKIPLTLTKSRQNSAHVTARVIREDEIPGSFTSARQVGMEPQVHCHSEPGSDLALQSHPTHAAGPAASTCISPDTGAQEGCQLPGGRFPESQLVDPGLHLQQRAEGKAGDIQAALPGSFRTDAARKAHVVPRNMITRFDIQNLIGWTSQPHLDQNLTGRPSQLHLDQNLTGWPPQLHLDLNLS